MVTLVKDNVISVLDQRCGLFFLPYDVAGWWLLKSVSS